jgi:hypothetical protein
VAYVVTGQFLPAGPDYRLSATIINSESAAREAASRLDVRNDEKTQKLIEALGSTNIQSHSAGY